MKLQIRNIVIGDFDSIFDINRTSIPNVFELNAHEFSLLLNLCEYSKVINFNNEIAGYIFVVGRGQAYDGEEYNWFCENLNDEFLYVDQIAIGGKWQGMGCGRALYKDLENYAVNHQKTALVCEVNYKPLNQSSMAFHKRLGFNELSHLEARGIVVSLLAKRDLRENSNGMQPDSAEPHN